MKKLLSLLLSFTLILSPLSVQAADERAMDAYTKDGGTGSDKGKGFYMMQAGMLAVALAGANMVTCVPSSYHWSHYIFMGGGAALIAGEIVNIKEKTDYHKRKKESLEIKDANLEMPQGPRGADFEDKRDLQMTALKAARAEEENNKRMMEKRNKWIKIAAVTYKLAATFAVAEFGLSLFPVYTGFVPDVLSCPGLVNPMIMSAISLAYGIKSGLEQNNGKLGLSTAGFIALLHIEFGIVSGIAIPLVTTGLGRAAYFGGAALLIDKVKDGIEDRINIANTNIGKLDGAIAAWAADSAPSGGVVQGSTASVQTASSSYQAGNATVSNYLAQGAAPVKPVKGNCFGTNNGGVEHSLGACKNSIKVKPFNNKFILPELANANNQAKKMIDALANGDMLEAEIHGDGLLAGAARVKEISDEIYKDVNKKLKEKGQQPVDFNGIAKTKANDILKEMQDGANKGGFGMAGTATLADDSKDDKKSSSDSLPKIASKPEIAFPAAAAPGTTEILGSGVADSSTPAEDPTGMSDEEKDRLSANYDRTKGEYKPNEDDTLFRVVSKTYIRNLEKILTRKKKLDEGAASFPSEPSNQ